MMKNTLQHLLLFYLYRGPVSKEATGQPSLETGEKIIQNPLPAAANSDGFPE